MKIAINGIGIAGPTLAYWLQRLGFEPVLFEQAPAPRTGGYVVDFWGRGYELAERMGIMPTLRRVGYEMRRLRMLDRHGRDEALVELKGLREMLDGRFISLARADLAAAILEACRGIRAEYGVSVGAIEQTGGGCIATLTDGRREQFDLVIGADGLHSRVRELVFGPQRQFEESLGAYVAAFRTRGYPKREELAYVSRTVPQRQVARVSLRDDETLVLLVCRAEQVGGVPGAGETKAALRRAFGDMGWETPELLDRMDDSDDLYFDRVSQIHLPRWWSGRVALVGDAASCPSLLAGEGTGLAMIQAYVLAGELDRARGDFERAFAAYDARLRGFVTAKQKGALGFLGFFAPNTILGLRVRNLIVNALSVPFVARQVLARSVRDNIELPRYAF
jgi:2-polyprenyl-6-methoxyphenol hydroxylase-like FAD-dependent oxidoreductase